MPRLHRVCILLGFCFQPYAAADIIGVAGGWGPPDETLGLYEMTKFPLDDRPTHEYVTYVPSPLGGQIDFSVPLFHVRVGGGWGGGWHGYEGDVYASYGTGDSVTLDLPEQTRAFYFYASNILDHPVTIAAVADDGTTVYQKAQWAAAVYFGFYQDDPFGPPIEWIEVSCPSAGMVAVGEFAIAIPGPGALALVGMRAVGPISGRRRRRSLVG